MILIDTYEPDEIKWQLREESQEVNLPVGDYLIAGRNNEVVLVERKSTGDLLSSFSSGRLMRQLREMSASAEVPVLLIEGFLTVDKECRVRWKGGTSNYHWTTLEDFFLSCQLHGIHVVRSPNRMATSEILAALAKFFRKDSHSALLKRERPRLSVSTTEASRLGLVMGLPGIGEELARRLLSHFGSPHGVFVADDLTAVDGVGEVRARRIREVLGG